MIWFVLCSGPSLTPEDIELVRLERLADRARVVAVNSTVFSVPFADVCFGWDHTWWKTYGERVKCRKVSTSVNCATYGVEIVKGGPGAFNENWVCGNNSGHRAITYAYTQAAKPVELVLMGFDCQHVDGRAHHHADHPAPMGNAENPHKWARAAVNLADGLRDAGAVVTNCSPLTALDCFPVMTLEKYLGKR